MRDELGADEDEEGEGALPREERAPPTVGDSAAAPRDSSRSAAPAASRSGLVMLGLVQLALTSPFASFETLVTPFTEVSTINKHQTALQQGAQRSGINGAACRPCSSSHVPV